jgi:hypothetical protein
MCARKRLINLFDHVEVREALDVSQVTLTVKIPEGIKYHDSSGAGTLSESLQILRR